MKKNSKKIIMTMLVCLMVLGVRFETSAATEVTNNGTTEADISKYVSSEFSVLIPKQIELGEDTKAEFEVLAKGNIAPTEEVVVSVDKEVDMNRVGEEDYDDMDATVTLLDCTWNHETLTSEYNGKTGSVVFEETKAGKYYGTGTFYIDLEGGPKLTEGNGSTYSLLVTPDLTFRVEGSYGALQEVQVNGETVDARYYTVSEGDTVICLSGEYLLGLEAKEHQIAIITNGGTATGVFTAYDGIPEGCSYMVKATGEVLTAGDNIPAVPAQGDIYQTEDYEFHYMQMKQEDSTWEEVSEEELEYVASQYVQQDADTYFGKWFFAVIDESKESYGEIPAYLFGEPNKNLTSVFANCENLIYAPKIPSSAKNMIGTFYNCSSLLDIPELPSEVFAYRTFDNCDSLVKVALPDGFVRLGERMFYGCDNLSAVYIPSSVSLIVTDTKSDSPFYKCGENLKLYCGAEQTGEGWGEYWNYYGSMTILDVEYGVTYAEFKTK